MQSQIGMSNGEDDFFITCFGSLSTVVFIGVASIVDAKKWKSGINQ